jgi:hypothetical protein
MITYFIGLAVKTLFDAVIFLLRYTIFSGVWDAAASKISAVLQLPGVSTGLGIYDTFVGIDFTVSAVALAVTIIITIRLIRLIMGLLSKA